MRNSTMSWKRAAPLLLTIAGALGIGGLWLKRAFDLGFTPSGILVGSALVTYIGWMWWESRVSVAELDKREPDRDPGVSDVQDQNERVGQRFPALPARETNQLRRRRHREQPAGQPSLRGRDPGEKRKGSQANHGKVEAARLGR